MANSPLLRIESMLRRLVEQPFTWLSGSSVDPFALANHLLQLYQEEQQNGRQIAQFTIYLNPASLGEADADPDQLAEIVATYLGLLAERTGHALENPPRVRIEVDPAIDAQQATVVASEESTGPATSTQLFTQNAAGSFPETIRERDAFIIIQGRQHFPLDQPVIRIGRRTDNDVVLDSPTVSRYHAQIRWRNDDFVLFDTSSHGRTLVNGEPQQEYVLQPGDVIALSDVLLIYGEESFDTQGSHDETSPVSPTVLKPPE